jgi:hypothetical protein
MFPRKTKPTSRLFLGGGRRKHRNWIPVLGDQPASARRHTNAAGTTAADAQSVLQDAGHTKNISAIPKAGNSKYVCCCIRNTDEGTALYGEIHAIGES